MGSELAFFRMISSLSNDGPGGRGAASINIRVANAQRLFAGVYLGACGPAVLAPARP
jgi:hypothetical protein